MSKLPILEILAGEQGVHEVVIRVPADAYAKAERLSAGIAPAIEAIDAAMRDIYARARQAADLPHHIVVQFEEPYD